MPKDPAMLLSFINLKLRDYYSSLEALCEDLQVEEKEIFKVYYNKQLADYNNQVFYEFNVNRELKKRLKQRIKEGKLDAFKLNRNG